MHLDNDTMLQVCSTVGGARRQRHAHSPGVCERLHTAALAASSETAASTNKDEALKRQIIQQGYGLCADYIPSAEPLVM